MRLDVGLYLTTCKYLWPTIREEMPITDQLRDFAPRVHTFYNPLASWASPYFVGFDLAIARLAHIFQAYI